MGRCLEVELSSGPQNDNLMTLAVAAAICRAEETYRCLLFAWLMDDLFVNNLSFPPPAAASFTPSIQESTQKKVKSHDSSLSKMPILSRAKENFDGSFQMPSVVRVQKLGIPASLCLMSKISSRVR